MDYGWQNPEGAANNRPEYLKLLASKLGYVGLPAQPQTSGIREFLCRFATMISLRQPLTIFDYNAVSATAGEAEDPVAFRGADQVQGSAGLVANAHRDQHGYDHQPSLGGLSTCATRSSSR